MPLSNILKYVVAHAYKPWLIRYLSRPRHYNYKGINLVVPPEVFHPGFFFSTKLLLTYIAELPLDKKSFLELGAGSGLIACYAATRGSRVTATDINPVAIKYLEANRQRNGLEYQVIFSDLFDQIPAQTFDMIAINPPYYKKQPVSPADYAWYCGEKGEYFFRLFEGLPHYLHADSIAVMVINDQCDLQLIKAMALKNGFRMYCVHTHRNWLERNFIYRLVPETGQVSVSYYADQYSRRL